MSKRQIYQDREPEKEEYYTEEYNDEYNDEYDDLEIDFPDEEFPELTEQRRQVSEEEEYELRKKRRRQMQMEQKKAAIRRERIFVGVFLAALILLAVGLFMIIRAARAGRDPAKQSENPAVASADNTEENRIPVETEKESLPESAAENTEENTEEPVSEQAVQTVDPASLVTDAAKVTKDPLDSTDENGNWVPPYPTDIAVPSWITPDYIEISEKTRPGRALTSVDNIVIHYVGNPGTSAKANRDYFNDIAYHDNERGASAHFVVGLNGEIIQCVPLGEMAQANYPRNDYTISIETCHPDVTGQFSETTYRTLIKLTAWLCEVYGLTADDVIRHYDVSGKLCPIYYCPNQYGDNPYSHEEAWELLKADVRYYMDKYPDIAHTDP